MKKQILIIFVFFYVVIQAQVIPTGAVGHWPFDGNANDYSGNGNHGVVTGAVLTKDRFGNLCKAYKFDGVNDKIVVNHDTAINMTNSNNYTIALWEKTYPTNSNGMIMAKHNVGVQNGYYFWTDNSITTFYCNTADHLMFYTAAGPSQEACSNSAVCADTLWHFIVGVYNASANKSYLYVDTVLQNDIGQRDNTGNMSNTAKLSFGTIEGTGAYYFTGAIDDVRIYKRVLTKTEIIQLFNETNSCLAPNANFGYQYNGASVSFQDSSISSNAWNWSFGDGSTSNQQNPLHTYTASGTYNVCLIVSEPCCGNDTICKTVDICIEPVANFGISSVNGLTVSFMDSSVTNGTWSWTFGDGGFSSQQNPVHAYSSSGTYSVCLVVTDSCGSDTICKSVSVCLNAVANFSYSAGGGLSFNFTNMSSNATSWWWDFGDGTFSNNFSPSHTYSSIGAYIVCLRVNNSCSSDTLCIQIDINGQTGISPTMKSGSFSIIPNPTNGLFRIRSEFDGFFEIKNILGENVAHGRINETIDLSSQPDNLYFIDIFCEGNYTRQKLILIK